MRTIACLLLIAALAGCGGGSGSTTQPMPPAGISLSPSSSSSQPIVLRPSSSNQIMTVSDPGYTGVYTGSTSNDFCLRLTPQSHTVFIVSVLNGASCSKTSATTVTISDSVGHSAVAYFETLNF